MRYLLTVREVVWNWVHLVLQHLGMECGDVERLHSIWQASSQHSIHVHTTAAKEQTWSVPSVSDSMHRVSSMRIIVVLVGVKHLV